MPSSRWSTGPTDRNHSSSGLGPEFFGRNAEIVARELLGAELIRYSGRKRHTLTITETEAYLGPMDLACHSARGRTPRTEVMYGPPGSLYVYLIYGLHLMLNVVTGNGAAVLIRGAGAVQGPGRLGRYLSLDRGLNGKPANQATGLWFEGRTIDPCQIVATPRIGVSYAGERWSREKLRFILRA